MKLKFRYGLVLCIFLTCVLLVVWMAQRPAFARYNNTLHIFNSGNALKLQMRTFPGATRAGPGELFTTGGIPPLGNPAPLNILAGGAGDKPVRLKFMRATTVKATTDEECMFNGPRQLVDVGESILAPHVNNTWVVLNTSDGNVFHPSERFCAAYIDRHYLNTTQSEADEYARGVILGSSLRAVLPAARQTHRCRNVRNWIGADCRIGTGERALLADCITREKLIAQTEAQCTFAHVCCHEIRTKNRPFRAFPRNGNSSSFTIFFESNGTDALFMANRYSERLDARAYALADWDFIGYSQNTYAPANLTSGNSTSNDLWLVMQDAPGASPRNLCRVDALWKLNNGVTTKLNGSWDFFCKRYIK
jgi:hypothetical protein